MRKSALYLGPREDQWSPFEVSTEDSMSAAISYETAADDNAIDPFDAAAEIEEQSGEPLCPPDERYLTVTVTRTTRTTITLRKGKQ